MNYNALMPSNPRLKRVGRVVRSMMPRSQRPLSTSNYYNAGVMVAYGKTNEAAAELGDLFNDVMGAVVPGWDQRPDWMKKIAVKPDPNKILQAAQRVAPNAGRQVISAAEKAGLNVFVNTPAGQVAVSPDMAQGMYAGMPFFTRAQSAFESVPGWVWGVGAGGILLLLVSARR